MIEIEHIYNKYLAYPKVCTDSRAIEEGSMFFALKGENFDANEFALQAIEQGAAFAVVDDKTLPQNDKFICVENVVETLQDLARHHRNQFDIPFIAITGTNGKTTTKELAFAVLSKKYKVLATKGNFNNHIGVPLTLLRLEKDHEIAIIEMGANHLGEINFLCQIADPDYGIITNIGKAHLKGFGSFDGVLKAKTELYRYINSKFGKIFVQKADTLLMKESELNDRIYYGSGSEYSGDYSYSEDGKIELHLNVKGKDISFSTNLFGSFNFDNLLSAYCIGATFSVPFNQIDAALSSYMPDNNRSQVIKSFSNTIILDAYNANPSSVELALTSFSKLEGKEKVIILGDMLELGSEEENEHKKIIELIHQLEFKDVILVGSIFGKINDKGYKSFPSVEELNKYLEGNSIENSRILVKGSRGIALEKLLDKLS